MTSETARVLLERGDEVARLAACLDGLPETGCGVVLVGEAGIGKTTVLQAGEESARGRGVHVVRVVADELEQAMSFTVLRSLFASMHNSSKPRGAAKTAARALGLTGEARSTIDEGELFHGLAWWLHDLAGRTGVAVVFDDAHVADPASLRFFRYVSRRLPDLPIALLIASRTREPVDEFGLEMLELGPLSIDAVSAIVRNEIPGADDPFCRACYDASGGNPFLCREIASDAAMSGAETTIPVPRPIVEWVTRRLRRLSADAAAVAEAVAVLGSAATALHVGRLTALPIEAVANAVRELTGAGVLVDGKTLALAHPIMASALVSGLSPTNRSEAHRRAARVLSDHGAPPINVAAQLLASQPAGDQRSVDILRAAARRAAAPDLAVRLLRRAVDEGASPEDGSLAIELATAAEHALDTSAAEELDRAASLTTNRTRRADLLVRRVGVLIWLGHGPEAVRAAESARSDILALGLPPAVLDEYLRSLEGLRLCATAGDIPSRPDVERLDGALGAVSSAATRRVAAYVAYWGALMGLPATRTTPRAREALHQLADDELLLDPVSAPMLGTLALEFGDALQEADRQAALCVAAARDAKRPIPLALGLALAARVHWLRGDLVSAVADAEDGLEIARQNGMASAVYMLTSVLALSLTDLGDHAGAESVIASVRDADEDALAMTALVGLHHHARGHLLLDRGDAEAAIEEFRRAGTSLARGAHDHPAFCQWRADAAAAHLALGDDAAALAVAEEDLVNAERLGAPRVLGVALRTEGVARRDERQLRRALAVLGESPARLERAKAELALGSWLRRRTKRGEAERHLARALELADSCGGAGVVEAARQELRALGYRPRRAARAGVGALTPAEARVADLAARGSTNKEIAQALFLSIKTVEKHLSQSFRKLGVRSRTELRGALRPDDTD